VFGLFTGSFPQPTDVPFPPIPATSELASASDPLQTLGVPIS
jgi:hypothetical protein